MAAFLTTGCSSGETADSPDVLREKMVQSQLSTTERGIKNAEVLRAMRTVPRHLFVPEETRSMAYQDRPLPIGYDQTISQPYIVALMSQLLDVKAGAKVLEVGTGSGYQAAVLAEMGAEVYSIEIVPELAARAKKTLADAGYQSARVRDGDGYRGWPEFAPFDSIIVTCSPRNIPMPLVEQLRLGGRMVIPVGEAGAQELLLLVKEAPGSMKTTRVLPVRFVPMTGEAEH